MVIIEIKSTYVGRVMDEYHGNEILKIDYIKISIKCKQN
jgi:hypothetical protein